MIESHFNIIISNIMGKTTKRTTQRCTQHEFSLRPKGQYMSRPQNYLVSFCKNQGQKGKKKGLQLANQPCIDYPRFNNDKNYASPTFILCSEKNLYEEKKETMRQSHDEKFNAYNEQKTQLLIPKPRTKSNYCSVCRNNYEDYLDVRNCLLQHIKSLTHKKKIQCCTFNKYIKDLEYHFNKPQTSQIHPSDPRRQPKSSEQGTISAIRIEDSDDVYIISNPQKKISKQNNSSKDAPGSTNFPIQTHLLNLHSNYNLLNNIIDPYLQYPLQYTLNYNMNYFVNSYQLMSNFFYTPCNFSPMNGITQQPNMLNFYGQRLGEDFKNPKQNDFIVIDE